jgi:hypothetical protein
MVCMIDRGRTLLPLCFGIGQEKWSHGWKIRAECIILYGNAALK